MICLKNKLILFLLAFIATLQVGLVFRVEYMIKTMEAFEPIMIYDVSPVEHPEATTEVITEQEISVVESETLVVESVPPRITCPLDDETQQMIVDKSEEHNIDFAFTMGVIYAESRFQADADSGSSVGLMQINRINHQWLAEKLGITDFWDPEQNVTAGLHMLQMLFEKYEDPALVLMAYNMGETGAKRHWDKGIYTSDYAEAVLQQAEIYNQEIQERMGENGQV